MYPSRQTLPISGDAPGVLYFSSMKVRRVEVTTVMAVSLMAMPSFCLD